MIYGTMIKKIYGLFKQINLELLTWENRQLFTIEKKKKTDEQLDTNDNSKRNQLMFFTHLKTKLNKKQKITQVEVNDWLTRIFILKEVVIISVASTARG